MAVHQQAAVFGHGALRVDGRCLVYLVYIGILEGQAEQGLFRGNVRVGRRVVHGHVDVVAVARLDALLSKPVAPGQHVERVVEHLGRAAGKHLALREVILSPERRVGLAGYEYVEFRAQVALFQVGVGVNLGHVLLPAAGVVVVVHARLGLHAPRRGSDGHGLVVGQQLLLCVEDVFLHT